MHYIICILSKESTYKDKNLKYLTLDQTILVIIAVLLYIYIYIYKAFWDKLIKQFYLY